MRKAWFSSVLLMVAALAIAQQGSSTPTGPHDSAPAKGQAGNEIVGSIGDSVCGRVHTVQPGTGAAGCTRYCVLTRHANYILVVGDKIYTMSGDAKELDNFAGETVRVRGTIGGNSIKVQSIAAY